MELFPRLNAEAESRWLVKNGTVGVESLVP